MAVDLGDLYKEHGDEYLKFDRVKEKFSNRPDLNAFIMLDKLMPEGDDEDIIGDSEHDEFYLSIDCEKLAEVATEEQFIDLIRCGVRYDDGYLCMFS